MVPLMEHRLHMFVAQGDVIFRRIAHLPEGTVAADVEPRLVISHSETGHHHVIDDTGVVRYDSGDPLICYLRVDGPHADVLHLRPWDTHAPVRLDGGGALYEVRRQREWTPEGWRRVQD